MKLCELTVSRTISAPAEDVFDAWMDSNTPGGPWFGADRAIMNPSVDGLFYHSIDHEGRNWAHYGRFIALDRPRLIQHTWVSESTKGVESTVTVTLSLNTADALDQLSRQKFGAVISDMDRKEGPVEGYVLLEAMHSSNYRTPIFFYSSASPDQRQETLQLGGQGRTDNANELFSMVIDAVSNGKPKAALAVPQA